MEVNTISGEIISAAIEVHEALGPGLLESAYEECLAHELGLRGLYLERQTWVAVPYKGIFLDCGYRLDMVVEKKVVIELKSVAALLPIHKGAIINLLEADTAPTRIAHQLQHGLATEWHRAGCQQTVVLPLRLCASAVK